MTERCYARRRSSRRSATAAIATSPTANWRPMPAKPRAPLSPQVEPRPLPLGVRSPPARSDRHARRLESTPQARGQTTSTLAPGSAGAHTNTRPGSSAAPGARSSGGSGTTTTPINPNSTPPGNASSPRLPGALVGPPGCQGRPHGHPATASAAVTEVCPQGRARSARRQAGRRYFHPQG